MLDNSKVHFLSRPRRFGKSLFLSTLQAYFLGQKELFKGLVIKRLEEAQADRREIWQEYPVFYLDFNTGIYDTKEGLLNRLLSFLQEYEKIYASTGLDIPDRFQNMIRAAYEKTGKQAVVLVDEYDKPLLQTMWKDELLSETYRTILKGFYGVIKSTDQYLCFAFLTGVTKFSKVSIFSDLNNLKDISMREEYAAVCGMSAQELQRNFEPEIQALAEKKRYEL